MDLEQTIYQLVLHGGNARAEAYSALEAAESFDFDKAEQHLQQADDEFYAGHKWQTQLVQSYNNETPNFLIIHAQDQLMTALAEVNLVKRMIRGYKQLADLNQRLNKLEKKTE
jgi:PTS system cellobiose-specific IIA component